MKRFSKLILGLVLMCSSMTTFAQINSTVVKQPLKPHVVTKITPFYILPSVKKYSGPEDEYAAILALLDSCNAAQSEAQLAIYYANLLAAANTYVNTYYAQEDKLPFGPKTFCVANCIKLWLECLQHFGCPGPYGNPCDTCTWQFTMCVGNCSGTWLT